MTFTGEQLAAKLRSNLSAELPLPGGGKTALRHRVLKNIGRQDLSYARLAEAHWDAVAILAETGRQPERGAIYGVWASEVPGHTLELCEQDGVFIVTGSKKFCSGAGLVDRSLVTITVPQRQLVDIDLRKSSGLISFDDSSWKTCAFRETKTATVSFRSVAVSRDRLIEKPGWYFDRPGFWHGACGPAACWAGGAEAIYAYAKTQHRKDPHSLAHLGAMHADVWALNSFLECAGNEIDSVARTPEQAKTIALTLRHLVEQCCTDILRRSERALGPHPLAFDEDISRRVSELTLYLRQSHAERDLEALASTLDRPR